MILSEMPELPELITRVEMFYNDEDEQVDGIEEATWKYVTTFNEDDSIDEQYRVEIIDGIDQEYVEEEADESFQEGDRERIPAGQPDGGQWVGDGDTTQSKTTRGRTFDREISNHERRINNLKERIPILQAKVDDPNYDEENNEAKGIIINRIERMKKNIIKYTELKESSIKMAKDMKEKWSKLDLFEISDIGANTHSVGSKGFKNGVTQNTIGDWKIEFRGDRMDFLSEKDTGRGISPEAWDERFKEKTMINSNITKTMDEDIVELQDEIMYLWNDVLSDKQREGVDVLKIYYTANPKWKIRHGNKERTLGTHGGRKITDDGRGGKMMMSPSILTINLTGTDTPDSVLNTIIHEVNHSMWDKNLKDDHEKINKFTDKILALGKDGSVTNYAGSYFDDLDTVHTDYKEQITQLEKTFKDAEGQDPNKQYFLDKYAEDYKENIKTAQRLIANETHSEYFGMIGSPTSNDYHTSDTVKLKEIGKLIKEGLYD